MWVIGSLKCAASSAGVQNILENSGQRLALENKYATCLQLLVCCIGCPSPEGHVVTNVSMRS